MREIDVRDARAKARDARTKVRAYVRLGIAALLLATCAYAQQKPARIISLVPGATEMLFAIGAGPRVVAVSSYDKEPPQVTSLPRVGALLDPDVERILSLKPDLIVVYHSQHDLIRQLERAGVSQFSYVHGGLADIFRTIRDLAVRTGDTEQAAQVVKQIDDTLADIRRRVAGQPRPKTMIVFGREPGSLRNVYASGGYGFLHDVLDIAGGEDVFSDVKRESVQASTELVLTRAPDVIVELRADDESAPDLKAWQAVPSVPAVKNHRIVVLTGSDMVTAGPRIGQAALRLAKALHPDVFR
jgi:iron complex transport system substrate-binding protein